MERIAAIIGAGLIGRAWAMVFARAGWRVRLYDSGAGAARLRRARQIAASLAEQQAGRAGRTMPRGARPHRAVHQRSSDALAGVDWVQENLPEEVDVKRERVRRRSTGSRRPTRCSRARRRRSPRRSSPTILRGARAASSRIRSIRRISCRSSSCAARRGPAPRRIERARAVDDIDVGQVPIVVRREIDGFILNRLQGALLSEAMRLVGEGYVSPDDLDKTVRDGLGLALVVHGAVRDDRAERARRRGRLLRALQRLLPPAREPTCAVVSLGRGERRARRGRARHAVDYRAARSTHRVARPAPAGAARHKLDIESQDDQPREPQ